MKKVGRFVKVVALPLALLLAGCVRNLQEPAKITMNVPATWQSKNVAQEQSGTLIYAVINIRGEGIPGGLIFWNWLAGSLKHNQTTPPSAITIEVPSGPKRIIQYVGVYKHTSETLGERYLWTYGDVHTDLPSGDVPVTIAAKELLDAGGGESSEVQLDILAGRYLNAENKGPTTLVTGSLYIPAAKSSLKDPPPMVDMFKVGMFDGWFKTLLFPRAQLTWKTASGEVVADKVSSESLGISETTTNRAKFSIPTHYRPQGTSTELRLSSVQQVILGWFGEANQVGRKNICYIVPTDTNPLIVPGLFAPPTDGRELPWGGDGCTPARTTSTTAVCPIGGVTIDDPQKGCSSEYGVEGEGYLRPVHRSFGHEFDSILAFNGPFKLREEEILSGRVISASYDSDAKKYTVTWQYVSAGAGAALGGVSVYSKSSNEIIRHDAGQIAEGMNCDERAKLLGYEHLGDARPTEEPNGDKGKFELLADMDRNRKFVLCPFIKEGQDKKYFPSFVSTEFLEITNSKLNLVYKILSINSTNPTGEEVAQPAANTCYKLQLTLTTSSSQSYNSSLQAFYGTQGSHPAPIFYLTADCAGTSVPEFFGITPNGASGTFVKFPSNNGSTFTLLSRLSDNSRAVVAENQSIISVNGSGGGQSAGSGP